MPTNTPNPRITYTCLQPVRRGSRPPLGCLPHSRTTLPEPAVPQAPSAAPGGAPAPPGPGPAAAALTAGPAAPPPPPLRRPARAMAGGRDALPGDGRDPLRARAGPGRGALPGGRARARELPGACVNFSRGNRAESGPPRCERAWRWASGQGQPAQGGPGQVLPTLRETTTLWPKPRTLPLEREEEEEADT